MDGGSGRIAAVFWLSLSALALEVLLARLFSLGQWHHLGFMVLSIALFGFGASGTLLSLRERSAPGWERRNSGPAGLFNLVLAFSATALLAGVGLGSLPLDYFRLPLEPVQAVYLGAAYLLLALPFGFAGASISLAYAAAPGKSGAIYFANMGGSALGAALPALGLPWLDEGRLAVLAGLLPMGLLPFWLARLDEKRPRVLAAVGIAVAALFLLSPFGGKWVQVRPSPYKALPQTLQFPQTRIVGHHGGIRGRVDRVESPYLRFAPGLSLQYARPVSTAAALYRDAERPVHLYPPGETEFTRYTLAWAGYLASERPDSAFLVVRGGGVSVPTALAAGADPPRTVTDHPEIARALSNHYGWPVRSGVPRALLRRSDDRFGVIHLENWGPSIPGAGALEHNDDATVEAMRLYLRRLLPGGALILNRRLLLPPSDLVRHFATAWEALRAEGAVEPGRHIAVLRSWDVYVLLVSPTPLAERAAALRQFARDRNFDLVHLVGMDRSEANRFNRYDAPFYFDALAAFQSAARAGKAQAFFADNPLDLAPRHDDRPYPGRFMKWFRLPELYRATGERFYTLMMSGELVVLVVLAESFLVALVLLLPPLIGLRGRRGKAASTRTLYFLAVGAGFMLAEMFFIKALTALFADPVVSFAAVLASVMVASGTGGFLSRRWSARPLAGSLALLTIALLVAAAALGPLIQWAIGLSPALRTVFGLVLPVPFGLLMGVPFAAGMRLLSPSPGDRAVAWAANGCTSVLASVVAAEVALVVGISALGWTAAAAYGVALLSGFRAWRAGE